MPIRRIFFDWDRPALVSATEYLAEQFGLGQLLDLEDVVVAVPGGRAGRRLLEILVDRADRDGRTLIAPTIITVGKLPELLYQAKRPFADGFTRQLAWLEALRKSEPEQLERLSLTVPDEAEADLLGQLGVGEMLGRLHGELAADGLDCEAVAARGGQSGAFREEDRWHALAHVQRRYLATLDQLDLWDLQTARLYAIRNRECHTDSEIVLTGTVDLNRSQRQMLDQVADRVTTLIFAPERLADHFDRHGCLRAEKWQDVPIPLADDAIEVVETSADQAKAAVRAMAAFDGRYAPEQITLGVPDERVIPYLVQQLDQCGAATRYGAGTAIAQSPPRRLLAAVADYLENDRFSDLAAIVRHPAVDDWLADQSIDGDDRPSLLDCYHAEHVPHALAPGRLTHDGEPTPLGQVHQAVKTWLAELAEPPRPLDQWGKPIVDLLLTVFGRSVLDPDVPADRSVVVACERVHAVLTAQAAVPADLMPTVSGADAVRLVLRQIASERIPPPADRNAVELLGWLELALDDAPALVVTGLNEGIVPASLNADLFLPNRLRKTLQIEDNHRRYARDAYALNVLAASRESLILIAGRTAPEGEPLYPSRLLFACDASTIARRVTTFFRPDVDATDDLVVPSMLAPAVAESRFDIPRPKPLARPITSMRVTEFRDYLACPYRYYLRHQLKLVALDDQAEELNALTFGLLLHEVLSEFGTGPAATSTHADEIHAYLSDALDHIARHRYGKMSRPAVRVQVEQLRARLAAFAKWQADWAAQGWRIEMIEQGPKGGESVIMVDGRPMGLCGRIDRIDRNTSLGRRIIFDYKSSDTASTPEKIHCEKGRWIDLQLPLYRHLAKGMGIEGPVDLGYLVLPKDTGRVGERIAKWTEKDLNAADRTATEVVRQIRNEVFWPPTTPPPQIYQEFAAICQDEQFGSAGSSEEEEEPASRRTTSIAGHISTSLAPHLNTRKKKAPISDISEQ